MSAYRVRPDEAISRRLGMADAGATVKPPISDAASTSRCEAVLALAPKDPAETLDARRAIARHAMKDAHGCTGARCSDPRHEDDRAAMTELLGQVIPAETTNRQRNRGTHVA